MRRLALVLAMVAVAALTATPTALASGAVRTEPGFNSNTLARNDDQSTGLVPIGFTANFFGTSLTHVYVNNNGNLTLDAPLATFTPFPLLATERQIIAPFFADVDTRHSASGVTTYGVGEVDGRTAFAANYIDVGYYNTRVDKLNSFQVVLIDRSDIAAGDFDIEFNYDKIQWETGDASGGSLGLGGNSARVGWSNGVDTSFELPGSAVNGAFLDSNLTTGLIHNRLNSTVDGRYVFQVRSGIIDPGPDPDPPCVNTSSSIRPPVNADGTSVFKRGSTIPVKVGVTCDGEVVDTLAPLVTLTKIGNGGSLAVNEVVSSSAADDGNKMRWDAASEQYIYNLSTKRSQFNAGQDLTAGRYELRITDPTFLEDVVVQFELAR